jgi:hypothetical protein
LGQTAKKPKPSSTGAGAGMGMGVNAVTGGGGDADTATGVTKFQRDLNQRVKWDLETWWVLVCTRVPSYWLLVRCDMIG